RGVYVRPRCGLQIVDPVEAAQPQPPAQGEPAGKRERLRPLVDQHLVEEAELLGKAGERAGRQEADPVALMVIADRCHRPERLDEIAERAEPDDEDASRALAPRVKL